jgi:hypothetical protein
MEKALELLDFMNFRLQDTLLFKSKASEKMFSLEAYDRMINLKADVVRRTRQMLEEWMKLQGIQKCEYALDGNNHVYRLDVRQGRLQFMIKNDSGNPDVFVARSSGWTPDWGTFAQLTGLKQSLPLEHLLGSFAHWSDKRFQPQEIVKEVRHYFSHLVFSDKPAFSFVGYLSHSGRLVGTYIRVDPGVPTHVYVELKNKRN